MGPNFFLQKSFKSGLKTNKQYLKNNIPSIENKIEWWEKYGLEVLFILGPRCLTTNDSPDKNAECMFPWKFGGVTLNECTNQTDPDGK